MKQEKTPQSSLLEIKELSISFTQYERGIRQVELPVIRDLSVTVKEGQVVAVVGASGSGKSLLAHAVLGILPGNAALSGQLLYRGQELTPKRLETLRGKEIALMPQNVGYLDPLMKIRGQVRQGRKDPDRISAQRAVFQRHGLSARVEDQYPFELSGGMARRVLVSAAVLGNPRLIIADEPTPGLHLEAAQKTLAHFRELADQGSGVLLITHDLELATAVADRVVVFYAGVTVEEASVQDFEEESRLRHPYTKALFHAMPKNGFQFISGNQPYVKDLPAGCPFGPRCAWFTEECKEEIPLRPLWDGWVRCVHTEEEPQGIRMGEALQGRIRMGETLQGGIQIEENLKGAKPDLENSEGGTR